MKQLILASASPRRKQILGDAGYSFEVVPSGVEGETKGHASPDKLAMRYASAKAEDVYGRVGAGKVVLGADTVVALGGVVYGKPKDGEDAARILSVLSGKTHEVITGYAIISDDMREVGCVRTKVTFNTLSPETISDYVASGKCLDKAGAYGIQDGYDLVRSIDGDYDNVVGLPLDAIGATLKEFMK